MTNEQAFWLASVIDGEIREGYSGRGMNGETTTAVYTEESVGRVISMVWQPQVDDDDRPAPPRDVRLDQLGRDGIVLY
jgi:hypothetical protein